jgi:lipoprotein-anchoring transpeptidase ErfK/SrfK
LIIAVICVVLTTLIILNIKKASLPLRIDKGKVTSISGLANRAADLEAKGGLLEAKSLYQKLTDDFPNSSEIAHWQKKIEELNIKLLFSSIITPKSILYEIKPGDTLAKIAKEFKTTVELIMRSNNLSSDKIVPGRKVKVWTSPFSIVVDKSQNILILKSDEEVMKTYIVATGSNNSTPVGNFKITNKLTNPTWFKAGAVVPASSPENILGSRWLGIDVPGYGIHGTTDPKNLGKQVTQGCVRMSNAEVEELYTIVPVGTEVTIVD